MNEIQRFLWIMLSVTLGAGFIKFHQFSDVICDGRGGGAQGEGGDSSTAFSSVKLCVMINLNLRHNLLCLSFVVVLYSMYSLYAIIRVALFDERSCHV